MMLTAPMPAEITNRMIAIAKASMPGGAWSDSGA